MKTYTKVTMTSEQNEALMAIQSFFSKNNGAGIDEKTLMHFQSIDSIHNAEDTDEYEIKIRRGLSFTGKRKINERQYGEEFVYIEHDGSLVWEFVYSNGESEEMPFSQMGVEEKRKICKAFSDSLTESIRKEARTGEKDCAILGEPRPLMYVVRVVNFSTEDCSETSRYYMDKTSDMNDLDQCDPIDGYTDRHDAYVAMKEEFNMCMQDAFFDESLLHGHNISCNPDEDGINVYIDGLLRCQFSIEAI